MIAARKILSDNSAFTTALGSAARIFYGEAKQTQTLPYCVLDLESTVPTHTKDANESVDYESVQVSYYAGNTQDARNLAKLGKAALDRFKGSVTVDTDSGETQEVLECFFDGEGYYPAAIENRDIYIYEQSFNMIIRK